MSETVEAIYERGVLRLKEPLALAEGTAVYVTLRSPEEVIVDKNEVASSEATVESKELSPSEVEAILADPNSSWAEWVAAIAALPPEGDTTVTDASRNHDKYLYGWKRDQ